ncbi:16S rRNA (guanine(966)-N(2))-methyltransferase RsmD [Richelia intracellularis]|uniref:16S rRNA (guanine(966)-N(2))-methyltransferase RsmD n=1 Tax=Richelia intracellularis TaxID=1164990 RepID=UPI0009D95116|nr:16S rRNA (guanine(966)-N(2))-methyltransferase RsmD [Richelia intracellularis]
MSLRIYGHRQLKTLPGMNTRPTSSRVRTAIFNIWQGAITNCHWLDLCTGSGAIGAEALCRGAEVVVGIEKSTCACDIIRQNWQKVAGQYQQWQIIHGDILTKLTCLTGWQFNLIYFDPPYASKLYQPALELIAQYQLLDTQGEIAVEHSSHGWLAPTIADWEICREKVYGSTGITFYRYRK